MNNNQSFAERFRSARLMKGFSLQDLADNLDNKISRQALHKYEKGSVVPDSAMIGLLCDAFGVRPDYFFRTTEVELGSIEFRKLKNLSAKEENKILEHAKDYLSRYLELENILDIETKFVNPLKDFPVVGSFADVEQAANQVRSEWKIGSDAIVNVVELLEDNHIKVIYLDAGDAYDGMQTWVLHHDIPVIAINQNVVKKDDRKRFTAMHELAHLLLPIPENIAEKEKEKYCHQFAAALLFPGDALKKELGSKRNRIHIQELGALKLQYGISMQAIIMRTKELEIISEASCKALFNMFKQMKWRIDEPVEYRGNEVSTRFDQLLFRALAEDLITVSKAAALKNLKVAEFHQLSLMVK
jgi:Zn-dependent peptidase ImmA (M78 family)/transcriptional regulator with XRE-family HTH domain